MNQKVLVLDIETSPMTAHVFGLKDQNIGLNQILKDWSVLAWAAKWLGDSPSKIMYKDVRNNKDLSDDKELVSEMWKLLDEADIVITQYGSGFDAPKLNARFIMHGMMPPSPYKHLDTYRIVKKVASFTSNKLEYLTDKLCTKYKKLKHKRFPGMSLWNECLNGNKKAWEEMKEYNINDVLSTEELYMKIRAWAPASMASPYYVADTAVQCRICGDEGHMTKRGFDVKKAFRYQRWKCTQCGSWATGEKIK